MTCPKCRHELAPDATECPWCGIVIAKYHGDAAPPPPAGSAPSPADLAAPHAQPPRPPRPRSFGRLGTLLLLAGIGAALYCAWPLHHPWPFPRLTLPPAAANPSATDPCAGRAHCVVVYITPWCPACRSTLPILQELQRRWQGTSIGLEVVVGQGELPEMEAMAQRVGAGAFIDRNGALWSKLGGHGVPHWYVLDAQGQVQHESSGTYMEVDAQISELGLKGAERRDPKAGNGGG